MLPRSFLGWVILIIVLLVIFAGWTQAGYDVHSWVIGIISFGHAATGH